MTPITQLSLIRPDDVAKILGCSVVYIYKLLLCLQNDFTTADLFYDGVC